MDRNKNFYRYTFSNGEKQVMTPIDAHKYSHKHKVDIWEGPNYIEGKKEKSFDGFGYHDGLMRSFKGPKDYRDYLKANNMVEAGMNDKPTEGKYKKPVWDEALIRKCNNEYKLGIDDILGDALIRGDLDFPDGSSEDYFNFQQEE